MLLPLTVTAFAGYAVSRIWRRRFLRELTSREAGLWTALWLLITTAVWNPHATDRMAWWFGIGRGADLLIFVSIVGLFALVSWLLARVGKIEREITTLVRETALRDLDESRIKNHESRIGTENKSRDS